MSCCDPIGSLPEHLIAHGALGIHVFIRRDVIANQGNASDHQPQIFIEDRTGAGNGDRWYLTVQDSGGTWGWVLLGQLP